MSSDQQPLFGASKLGVVLQPHILGMLLSGADFR